MTTVRVPGRVESPTRGERTPFLLITTGLLLGAALVGVLAWNMGAAWLYGTAGVIALAAAWVVATMSNLADRRGVVRLTRTEQGWALLDSVTSRRMELALPVVGLAICAATLVADPASMAMRLLVVIFVVSLLQALVGRRTPPGLRLEPSILAVVGYGGKTSAATWDEITGIQPGKIIRITTASGLLNVGTGQCHSDPEIVGALLKFYRARPNLRTELGDERVLRRIRSGQLD